MPTRDCSGSRADADLRRGDDSVVNAVIGKDADGNYVLCKGAKGVILAAGDYGNNPDLRKEYMPFIEGLPSAYCVKTNTGDGQLMGVAVGGVMQPAPHAGNIHYDPPVGVADVAGSGIPWLRVNINGERFSNEDVTYGQIYAADMRQPEYTHYDIFDDNFRTDWKDMGDGMMRKEPPIDIVAGVDASVEAGDVPTADTIADLATAIGMDPDTLQATVDRYNELCDNGYDEDFGKQARRLKAIKVPPFYAVKRRPSLLCSLNGLITNADMQCIDADFQVIPGLYATGNCQGNFFGGLEHPMVIPGMSLGRAMTTGRVAALRICGADQTINTPAAPGSAASAASGSASATASGSTK